MKTIKLTVQPRGIITLDNRTIFRPTRSLTRKIVELIGDRQPPIKLVYTLYKEEEKWKGYVELDNEH